jgi:hypothetical protein
MFGSYFCPEKLAATILDLIFPSEPSLSNVDLRHVY